MSQALALLDARVGQMEGALGMSARQVREERGGAPVRRAQAAQRPAPTPASPRGPGQLRFTVGRVLTVDPHPDPASNETWMETIDCGEAEPRTVCSRLRLHVPRDEFLGRLVLVASNLKPRPIRGVVSNGMVMCASAGDDERAVGLLVVPEGAVPGERVAFEGHPDTSPDTLNPKHKTWEAVAPGFNVRADGVVCWEAVPFMTTAGPVTSPIPNATIS